MDENSCEGETSGKEKKSVGKNSVQIEKVTDFILARNSSVGVKLEKNEDQVLNRSGSSLDHTGMIYFTTCLPNVCKRASSTLNAWSFLKIKKKLSTRSSTL